MKAAGNGALRAISAAQVTNETGATTLEFAIVSSLLLICVLGIMVCSLAVYANHFVSAAAKEATRYAIVRGSSWSSSCASYSSLSCEASSANVTSFVNAIAPPGISQSNIKVTTTWPGTDPTGATCDTANGTNSPTCVVNVQVQYTFNVFLPFVPIGNVVMSGVSSDVISR